MSMEKNSRKISECSQSSFGKWNFWSRILATSMLSPSDSSLLSLVELAVTSEPSESLSSANAKRSEFIFQADSCNLKTSGIFDANSRNLHLEKKMFLLFIVHVHLWNNNKNTSEPV